MNNTISLGQISRTGNLDVKLILRQYKLDLRARFMENKSINPKLKQKENASELGSSSSALKRHRYSMKIQGP